MTVAYRRVETSLQRMLRRPGGVKATEAIRAAEENLASIEGACSQELDRLIEAIVAVVQPGSGRRLGEAELKSVIDFGEQALTACGALTEPFLGEVLRVLCALADTLVEIDTALEGALEPIVNLLLLTRRGGIPAEEGGVVLKQLQRRLDNYSDILRNPT